MTKGAAGLRPLRSGCVLHSPALLPAAQSGPRCSTLPPKRTCPTWLKWATLQVQLGGFYHIPANQEPALSPGRDHGFMSLPPRESPQCLPVLPALPSSLVPLPFHRLPKPGQAVCPKSPSEAMGIAVLSSPGPSVLCPSAAPKPSSRPSLDLGAGFAGVHDS